jgi:hypothetical protein
MGLLEFYAEIIFLFGYLAFIISSAIYTCQVLGVWTWALIGIELAPEVAVWYRVNSLREKRHIEHLLTPYSTVGIEEKMDDYINEQKKH